MQPTISLDLLWYLLLVLALGFRPIYMYALAPIASLLFIFLNTQAHTHSCYPPVDRYILPLITIIMPNLLTIPNEILDEIASDLDALATSYLLRTCRSLSFHIAPAMLRHAVAPKAGIHALHWASERGHLPLVQCLLTQFPVDLPDRVGATALQTAASSCSNLVLEHLILHGADINHTDDTGQTALYQACDRTICSDTEATVRLLITHGADVIGTTPFFPLNIALDSQNLEIARILLQAGANPHILNSSGDPPIVVAARLGGAAWILQILLDHGADINACSIHGSTALLIAARYGYMSFVELLVEKGALLNCANSHGETPLTMAIARRRQAVAEYLVVKEGVDVLTVNRRGDSGVHLAAREGLNVVIRVLLEKGALMNYLGCKGRTPLHTAVGNGWYEVTQTLLSNGADMEMEDLAGITPLQSAINAKNLPITTMLINHGADPSNPGRLGSPPLVVACRQVMKTVVCLLLEKGVDVNCKGKDGLTPLARAKRHGIRGLVEILVAHGGNVGDSE